MNSRNLDFKVIHFSTGHAGGAGLAARRLNWELNNAGIFSKFYALEKTDYKPEENEYVISRTNRLRILSGISTLLNNWISNESFFSLFSINSITKKTVLKIANPNNTILHFHNWFNLSSQRNILKLASKGYQVVVTMHDQRFMTGGCHVAFSCDGLYSGCKKCPQLSSFIDWVPSIANSFISKKFPKANNNITFIAPSEWIMTEARKSNLLNAQNIRFIPNTLGNFMKFESIEQIDQNHKDKTIFGVASMDTNSYIKGGDLTSKLAKIAKEKKLPLEFLVMKDVVRETNSHKNFWRQIDYLFVPSRADNSPNVIHEAKKLGIPVIASKIGGISELLTEEFDFGIDIGDLNLDYLINMLLDVRNNEISEINRKLMTLNFSNYVSKSLQQHVQLYKELIALQSNKGFDW